MGPSNAGSDGFLSGATRSLDQMGHKSLHTQYRDTGVRGSHSPDNSRGDDVDDFQMATRRRFREADNRCSRSQLRTMRDRDINPLALFEGQKDGQDILVANTSDRDYHSFVQSRSAGD